MSKARQWAHNELRRTLDLLASAPADQLEHLRLIGAPYSVDELALELDDALPGDGRVEGLALTAEQSQIIQSVRSKLAAMSGKKNKELWQPQSLASRVEWEEVREAARRALAIL